MSLVKPNFYWFFQVLCTNNHGYVFVKENKNIEGDGIFVENGDDEVPMFFCKVMYGGKRYLGKYHPAGHGTCYIAVGEKEENEPKNFEILQSKS